MDILQAILLTCIICVCKGETHIVGSPISSVSLSNDINPNETVSSRQAGYGLIRFDGPVDHEGDQHGQLVTFTDNSQNNRPLKFEDDVGSPDTTIRNIPIPSSTAQNIVSFQDNTNVNMNGQNFNQHSGQRRRRRRRRKSRRYLNGVGDASLGAGQPKPRPNLTEMSGPLRVVSDALASILENDTKHCVKRTLCEQAATNEQINNSTLMQTVLSIFQYIPFLQRGAAINALPLANSVGVLSVAMRFGAAARNVSACAHRYPHCPNDPEERIHYMNNHNGGLFRFFRGNDQHQYTAQEFHNRLLKLGLKPQKHHAAGVYGLYQPEYGSKGEHLAHPYPFKYGLQKPYPDAGGQYGLQHNNLQPNPSNFNGPYHNQSPFRTSNSFAGQVNPYAGGQYGLQYNNYQPSPSNSNGPYHNQPLIGTSNTFAGQVKPNLGGQYGLQYNNLQPNPSNSNGPYRNQPTSNSFAGQVNPNQQGHSVYSPAYPHYRRLNYDGADFKRSTKDTEGNEIQRRIQNKPEVFTNDNNANSKWSFPKFESANRNILSDLNNIRGGRHLKFPDKENGQETIKQAKGFLFPGP